MHRINITKYVQFLIILMILNNVLSAQSESKRKIRAQNRIRKTN